MSRRRRERGDNPDDLLGALGSNEVEAPGADMTLSDFANEGYGSRVGDTFGMKGKTIRAKSISINEIHPDPTQPRRAIPSSVRHYWSDGDPENVPYLLEMWHKEVEVERGKSFDLDAYLSGEITDRAPEDILENDQLGQIGSSKANPVEAAFLEVVALAQSIKRDGLTNPITIAKNDRFYVIETGERRWLAYHLLNAHFGAIEDEWQKIPARIMDERSVWRQASENNARADLNAIGKARQFALLLMDLYSMGNFQPFDVFEHEQDFYAQVVDQKAYRVPRGSGEQILTAMGFQHKSAMKRHRDLLSLSPDVWSMADDYDCPESVLRTLINLSSKAQLDGIQKWIQSGKKVAIGNLSPSKEAKEKTSKFQSFITRPISQWEKDFEQLDSDSRREAIDYLRELLSRLEVG